MEIFPKLSVYTPNNIIIKVYLIFCTAKIETDPDADHGLIAVFLSSSNTATHVQNYKNVLQR